jgi:hypothetical protein
VEKPSKPKGNKVMNNPVRLLRCVVVGMLALNLVGCASIVHSGNRPVTIDSDPEGALVTITGKHGWELPNQRTPFTAQLEPHAGYFRGQQYTAKFELAGYETAYLPIYPQLSPWYLGNVVFGGLIGLVIVDPLTGSMWNLRPLHIQQTLVKLPEPPAPAPPPLSTAPPTSTPPAAPPEIANPPVQPSPPLSDNTNSPAQPPPAPPSNP